MKQVCLQWQNMVDEKDCGLVIGSLPFFIGRADMNDVVLPMPGSGVSRRHARLAQIGDDIVLTDLHSTNGIQIDGRRIGEAAVDPQNPFFVGLYRLTLEEYMHCQNDTCQRLISHNHTTCPWCGHFTADAMTRVLV